MCIIHSSRTLFLPPHHPNLCLPPPSQDVVTARERGGVEALALYRYPPLIDHAELSEDLRKKIKLGYHVKIKIMDGNHPKEFM